MTKSLAKDFNEWMAKMGNIHYSDNERMAKAFEIIVEHEEI
jgi:hypothetical protein